jgi:uncharacterized protein (DUF58 family)
VTDAAAPLIDARRGALAAAARWRLPFSRQAWRGPAGGWLGAGAGSSLDFQDHRAYLPGDDPRHIHWAAYARTGQLTMKLFRAEVSPVVDLVVDLSASMQVTPAKAARTTELAVFCAESAARTMAPLRVFLASGRQVVSATPELVRDGRGLARAPDAAAAGSPPGPISWRPSALKVLVSDLLFPGEPDAVLAPLAAGQGSGVVFVPVLEEEAELPWRGNLELVDCESKSERRQRIDATLAARYREAYARHFTLWREACRRYGVLFARVPCRGELRDALAHEARLSGAVEATQ